VTRKEELFEYYKIFLEKWFYKPPCEAVEYAMTLYTAHSMLNEKPVWSFILGPSSTGKSAIVLDPLQGLPNVKCLDTITPNSFLSGFKGGGILNNWTSNNIFVVFSDFSTFLGMRQEAREEIQGQLRRYFDMTGAVSKDVGNTAVSWEGKMTILAACTPTLENYWMVGRDLGERFLMNRLPYNESIEEQRQRQKYAKKHIGHETEIRTKMKEMVKEVVDPESTFGVDYDLEHEQEIEYTVILVALLRRTVERNFNFGSKHEITRVAPAEGTGRLGKQLSSLAIANAMMFESPILLDRGIKIAKKAALYTIPTWRYRIFSALFASKDTKYTLSLSDLYKVTGIPRTSLKSTVEELEAMEVLDENTSPTGRTATLKEEFIEIADKSNFILDLQKWSPLTKMTKERVYIEEDDFYATPTRVINIASARPVTRKVDWKADRLEALE